jgi:putative ABC transport system permease protein
MNPNIKIALRNLSRKPIYYVITFTGFTFGIIASLLIYLWVNNDMNYENFHSDYKSIYRVLTLSKQGEEIIKSPGC